MNETPLTRRLLDIRAKVEEHHEVDETTLFVSIACDSCGRVDLHVLEEGETPEAALEALGADWSVSDERPYFDLCPECS